MKTNVSLTARLALLFAAMACGLLVLMAIFIDRSVSAHFDELDLYDLSAKRTQLEALISQVNSADELEQLPSRIHDAFLGRETVALFINLPDASWQFSLNADKFNPIKDALQHSSALFHKWQTVDGERFIGYATRVNLELLSSSEVSLFIGLGISHHVHFLEQLRFYLAIGILGATLLAGFLGWFVAHKGLAPMRRVASTARRLSAKRLGERLSTDDAPREMQELVEAFNGMLERLEASFRRLNEFSDDIAHELRSPVSNLMTETQVVLSRQRSAEEYREVLHSNLEEFDRLARMIADMLFLAKTENERLPAPMKRVQLENEVTALFDFYEALAEEKQLHLTLEGKGSVTGEPLMLRRALSNLLSNAIRHTPVNGDILIRICPQSSGVKLTFSNTGEPIPTDQISRIFERFYRVDPSRSRQGDGSGLGLSITRSIIEAHGGEISAESSQSMTTFTIHFKS
ncbi:MAG: heavy metal sensor histidine kinase [Nitrincola sp.]|nr:heavy metal sensor histidine kinase [Nitrincola sp.]